MNVTELATTPDMLADFRRIDALLAGSPTEEQLQEIVVISDRWPLRTPVEFFYSPGRHDWKPRRIGEAQQLLALGLWLREWNPATLKIGSTFYASIGGVPGWEAFPNGALLEFDVLPSQPQAAVWTEMLFGLANNQFSHVCAAECGCGYTDAPLVDADAVFALLLCVRDGRMRIEIWLRSADLKTAESVVKRTRRLLLGSKFLPPTVSMNTFERLCNDQKKRMARF